MRKGLAALFFVTLDTAAHPEPVLPLPVEGQRGILLFAPLPKTNAPAVGAKTKGEARMSEASDWTEMERRLVEKSLQDDDFRQKVLADPRAAVEEEPGTRLPEGVRVLVMEETAGTVYLMVPFSSTGELFDRELEAVAGGWLEAPSHSQAYPTEACGC